MSQKIRFHQMLGHSGMHSPDLKGDPPTSKEIITPPEELDIFAEYTPFLFCTTLEIPIKCTCDLLGICLEADPMTKRNIIVDVVENSSASHLDWQPKLLNHTIVKVGPTPVYYMSEVTTAFANYDVMTHDSIPIMVAPHFQDDKYQDEALMEIAQDQLRVIHCVLHDLPLDMEPPVMLISESNLANSKVKLTRKKCLQGDEKTKWKSAEFSQLDKQDSYGMYGKPIPRWSLPKMAKVVRLIWNYTQKSDGTHKARDCLNGKQLARMGAKFEHTYAACMEQHCLWLLCGLCAYMALIMLDGDVVNAYAHSDAEGEPIYIVVDEVYQEWYYLKYKIKLNIGDCVPILKGLQGHQQAGKWWADHFEKKVAQSISFTPAFTEPTIYRQKIDGTFKDALMLRQVDDIIVATPSIDAGTSLLNKISNMVTFKINEGPTKKFYALNIFQGARYISLSAEDYIDHCMLKLGWDKEGTTTGNRSVPMTPADLKTMSSEQGPLEGSPEAKELEKKHGHPYRTLTGLLGFAVQLGRADINEVTMILSKFNNRPGSVHYTFAKKALIFLRRTKKKSWIYWRPHGKEISGLPYGDFHPISPETDMIPLFPESHPLFEPEGWSDASFQGLATIGEHRSVTGIRCQTG